MVEGRKEDPQNKLTGAISVEAKEMDSRDSDNVRDGCVRITVADIACVKTKCPSGNRFHSNRSGKELNVEFGQRKPDSKFDETGIW
jgi:hypothetical protein